jgi:hypothetical protein
LSLQGSLKLGVFFRSKFFAEKRSAAGDTKFINISFEKLAKIMCWAADKIIFKEIAACLIHFYIVIFGKIQISNLHIN